MQNPGWFTEMANIVENATVLFRDQHSFCSAVDIIHLLLARKIYI